jgi:hypothetical protein
VKESLDLNWHRAKQHEFLPAAERWRLFMEKRGGKNPWAQCLAPTIDSP